MYSVGLPLSERINRCAYCSRNQSLSSMEYIYGGKQGLILKITPNVLIEVLDYGIVGITTESKK